MSTLSTFLRDRVTQIEQNGAKVNIDSIKQLSIDLYICLAHNSIGTEFVVLFKTLPELQTMFLLDLDIHRITEWSEKYL